MEHSFRHDYGRLVATLVRRVGVQHIELVEDAVQSAFMVALTAWTEQAPPDDPGAWLYKVAYNRLIQDLRRKSGRMKILEKSAGDFSDGARHPENPFFPDEIRDDMLRMLFACCDEAIPWESQLVLALKTLCGFSTVEIALRLFTSEANVHKRLGRARDRLRQVRRTWTRRRAKKSAPGSPAYTECSIFFSTRDTCPRTPNRRSGASFATKP